MNSEAASLNRRDFVRGIAPALAGAGRGLAANDRIQVGIIGHGLRGAYLAKLFADAAAKTGACSIVAVCDVYRRRMSKGKDLYGCSGHLDYREVLNRKDVDAVVIATPDHWHARIAMEALGKGKDIYLEKPMCHTLEETKALVDAVNRARRIVQVGSQTTHAEWWWKTRDLIKDGAIGELVMSQGSYHRNSPRNWLNVLWPVDLTASPDAKGDDYVDWNMWLGSAPRRKWDADRFFRYRKYWDYSGGIATDLFFHVAAPLNICWGEPQFPRKVMASGARFTFHDSDVPAEVPDTFHLMAEYPKGHTVVMTSSMVNLQHVPGMLRGHAGTLIPAIDGQFEGPQDRVILRPEKSLINDDYKARFGADERSYPVERKLEASLTSAHIADFLNCVRSRKKPLLDVNEAARSQALCTLSVQAYREARVLYFDEKTWKATTTPPA